MSDPTLARDDRITFADRKVQLEPFPIYDKLREECPVYHDPVTGNYVLTHYEDVRKALLNVGALKNGTGVMGDRWCPTTRPGIASIGHWSIKYLPPPG